MSDDEDDQMHMDGALDMAGDGSDMMGFGPLLPTESERSLMERVRQELKLELKQVTCQYFDCPLKINNTNFTVANEKEK
jgi:hypothetical protein